MVLYVLLYKKQLAIVLICFPHLFYLSPSNSKLLISHYSPCHHMSHSNCSLSVLWNRISFYVWQSPATISVDSLFKRHYTGQLWGTVFY